MKEIDLIKVKFEKNLPKNIPVHVIEKVVKTCVERDIPTNLLSNRYKIDYGKSRHMLFKFEGDSYISVHAEEPFRISRIFDSEGELIAT